MHSSSDQPYAMELCFYAQSDEIYATKRHQVACAARDSYIFTSAMPYGKNINLSKLSSSSKLISTLKKANQPKFTH